jgi:phosphatidylglycerol---prolipoprotein diacylglyceryl transferase
MNGIDLLLNSLWAGLSRLANRTILYQNGSFIFVTFGLLVTGGAALWMLITAACFFAHGLSLYQTTIFIVGATISALLLSHFFWWIGHLPSMIRQPFWGMLKIGYVSWGGLVGVAVFCLAFSIACGYPLLTISDDVLRGLFAAYAVGRIGCLTYGCCYGMTTGGQGGHGIRYQNPDSKVVREKGEISGPRYPTQLYSCVEGIALFLLLNGMAYHAIPAGLITAASFLIYPIGRAYIELYRDRKRYLGFRFTSGQLACAAMFLIGWVILFFALDDANSAQPPRPLSFEEFNRSLSLVPAMIVAGITVFFATSFHWKRVGTW